jgi:hypothetical protein
MSTPSKRLMLHTTRSLIAVAIATAFPAQMAFADDAKTEAKKDDTKLETVIVTKTVARKASKKCRCRFPQSKAKRWTPTLHPARTSASCLHAHRA